MKILSKKEKVFDNFVEEYYLNSVFAGQSDDVRIGVLLLRIIAHQDNTSVKSIVAEAESEEVGVPHNRLFISGDDFCVKFTSVEQLSLRFDDEEIKEWTIKCIIDENAAEMSGTVHGLRIGVSYSSNCNFNFLKYLTTVENETYFYHQYNSEIINNLKKWFGLNQKNAVLTLLKIDEHSDIAEEFYKGMNGDSFYFNSTMPIEVEGYTAKRLFDEYPLSELGAYNYLIYLREKPKEALLNLRKGLPRK